MKKTCKKGLQFAKSCDILLGLKTRKHSSVGQSARFTSVRSQVRALLFPPTKEGRPKASLFCCGQEREPARKTRKINRTGNAMAFCSGEGRLRHEPWFRALLFPPKNLVLRNEIFLSKPTGLVYHQARIASLYIITAKQCISSRVSVHLLSA